MFAFTVVYGLSCMLMCSQYMLCRTLKIAKNGLDVEKIRKNIMPAKQQIALQRRMTACVTIGGADSIDATPRSGPSMFQKKFTEQMMSLGADSFGDESQESKADGGLAILRQFTKPKLNQVFPVPGFSDSPYIKKGKSFCNVQDSTGNQAFSRFRKKNTDQENPQFQTKDPSEATDANRQFRSKKVKPGEPSESDVSRTLDQSGVCSESMNNSSMDDSTYSLHSLVKKGYNSISKILDKKTGGFEEPSPGRRWTGNDADGSQLEEAGKEGHVVKSGIILSPQKVVDAKPKAELDSQAQSDFDESAETDDEESDSSETDDEESDSGETDDEESGKGGNGNDTSIIPDEPEPKKRLKTETETKPPQEPTDSPAETERVIINPIHVLSKSKFKSSPPPDPPKPTENSPRE